MSGARTAFLFSAILVLVLVQFASAGDFFLEQILFERESTEYIVGGYVYTVTLVSVFDADKKARFEVNGEQTDTLREGESYRLSDGAVIQVRDIMPQEAAEGRDLVQYNFFPASHPEKVEETVTELEKEPPVVATTDVAPPEKHALEDLPKEAVVDVTRATPSKNLWERFLDWIKELFS